ncbi:CocE/NonD family hydrolase [Mesorhizobium sp. M1216]|uniref:CocE/NonD family hydrolase n=1 Tax=Mesorhizobium sp. M1216 TaxID=2957069 RepID=UPI00333D072F
MRDGVGLRADIYRPRAAGDQLPTILIRTQYDQATYRDGASNTKSGLAYMFAGQGFAVVVQDIRGRFGSEGTFHPAESDADASIRSPGSLRSPGPTARSVVTAALR